MHILVVITASYVCQPQLIRLCLFQGSLRLYWVSVSKGLHSRTQGQLWLPLEDKHKSG